MLHRPDEQRIRISINSQKFTLAEDANVVVYPVDSQAPAFRPEGTIKRSSNKKLNKFSFSEWYQFGIGFTSLNRERFAERFPTHSLTNITLLADADADTANEILTLPHQAQSVTLPAAFSATGPTVVPDTWVNFNGEFYLLCHEVSPSSGNVGVGISSFESDDTYNGATTIQAGATGSRTLEGADVVEHKGKLYALYTIETADVGDLAYDIESSSDASTWADASGAGFPATTLYRVNDGDVVPAEGGGYPFGLLLDARTSSRHDLIAAIREESAASGGSTDQTRILWTANEGTGWTDSVQITGRPRGKAMWYDYATSGFPVVPYIATTTNVYLIDPANTEAVPILPEGILGGDVDDGFMTVGADGAMYVAAATGDIFRLSIIGIGSLNIENIGPMTKTPLGGEGLVAARNGPVTWMVSGTRFLYVAFQGATLSHICRFSYDNKSWHSFFLHDSTERIYRMGISAADDGTLRVHAAIDVGTSVELYQWEKPDNPIASTGANVEASGFFTLATDDYGDPHSAKALMTSSIDADDLDTVATIEAGDNTNTVHVEHEYGVNGAAATNVSNFGNFGSDDTELFFGKTNQNIASASEAGTPIGVSAKIAAHRFNLYRDGTATNGPKIREIQLAISFKDDDLNGFIVPIDVQQTALDQNIDVATVRSRINTIKTTVTSVALEYFEETAGTTATFYVEHVRRGSWEVESILPAGSPTIGAIVDRVKAGGIEVLYLEERLDV